MKRRNFLAGATLAGLVFADTAAQAQFGELGGLVKGIGAPKLPKILGGAEPVSTNIKDAVFGDPSKDSWKPPARAGNLTALARSPLGGFVLAAGYHRMTAQSYCLHAGTHGPGGGDGYLYGPLKGSARDAVASILQNSVAKPAIAQRDIQLLLWAIVSRSKIEDLNGDLKLIASQLLTPKQMASLNRSALSVLTSSEFQRVAGGVPEPLRSVMAAESRMRGMFSGPALAYQDMERVAVLAGAAPRGPGSVDTPTTRWSLHPDGYWVRYIPSGYSQTQVEIWVEPKSAAEGKVYDPALHIAVPGNTSRQRLAQSGREYRK
ncbi:MAG: hypothetical protein Q7T60_10455 [Sphingopyxis sp.]|nr:hypothetical protein [Sphingopyxis sp.]